MELTYFYISRQHQSRSTTLCQCTLFLQQGNPHTQQSKVRNFKPCWRSWPDSVERSEIQEAENWEKSAENKRMLLEEYTQEKVDKMGVKGMHYKM